MTSILSKPLSLFQPSKGKKRDIRKLNRRAELIGGQAVLALCFFYTLMAAMFTQHTSIARIRYSYDTILNEMFSFLIVIFVLLIVDVFYSLYDLRLKGNITTSRFYTGFLCEVRPWLLYITGIWFLLLMSVVDVEVGIMASSSYAIFFVGCSIVSLILALRDGCIDNRAMQEDKRRKANKGRKECTNI